MIALLRLVFENGGVSVACIMLASLAAGTVVLERLWRLLPMRAAFARQRARCHEALLRAGASEALAALRDDDPMGRVLRSGLQQHERGAELVRIAATNAAQREVAGIERGLTVVAMAAQIAPWLGLLGTVIGLMEVFQGAAGAPTVTNALVSSGIYKALGSTVAGLVLAIAAYIAYGLLTGLSNRLIDELENAAADLPVLLRAP
jgi:biopolymer transport protein ExbB